MTSNGTTNNGNNGNNGNNRTKQLAVAAALAAGVGLGSIAGAMFGAPSVSGAMESSSSTAAAVAVVEHPGPGPGRGFFRGEALETAAETIGISVEDLRTALRDGQTIAEVAEANGVDVQTVIGALVAEANARLDEAVANGRIDEEDADERRATIEERVTALVNGELRERFCDGVEDDGTADSDDTDGS